MVQTQHITNSEDTQPVDVEINDIGEIVIVIKNMPTNFEQKYDAKEMTYTLYARWKP